MFVIYLVITPLIYVCIAVTFTPTFIYVKNDL